MLYPTDALQSANFVASAVRLLLPIPAMSSHLPEARVPFPMDEVPPDPPPPAAPPDVARAAPHIPAPHAQPSVVQLCINDTSTSPSHPSTPLPRSRPPRSPSPSPSQPSHQGVQSPPTQILQSGSHAGRHGAPGAMTHLAWNCRGSGGSLRSSTMTHLFRLLVSTKAQETKQWNQQLLSTTFTPEAVQAITSTPVVHSQHEDILRWTPATNGQCTSKAIYSHLSGLTEHSLPQQGSRSISQDANSILQKGIRCYTDASTQPDVSQVIPRPAGIGIFIVNTEMQPPFSMFLKVAMQDSTSVIMAESAALALATSLCNTMDFHDVHFLSDNQMLVNCINGADPSNPPDWRIKPFTQLITASLTGSYKVHKIPRNQNQMADSLARRGLASLLSNQPSLPGLCTNPSHSHGCPLLSALQVVTINSVMVLAASCC